MIDSMIPMTKFSDHRIASHCHILGRNSIRLLNFHCTMNLHSQQNLIRNTRDDAKNARDDAKMILHNQIN